MPRLYSVACTQLLYNVVPETRAIMSAVQMLNPRAMLMRRKQALQVNVNAARGLQEVLKTNLGIAFPLSYYNYRSRP